MEMEAFNRLNRITRDEDEKRNNARKQQQQGSNDVFESLKSARSLHAEKTQVLSKFMDDNQRAFNQKAKQTMRNEYVAPDEQSFEDLLTPEERAEWRNYNRNITIRSRSFSTQGAVANMNMPEDDEDDGDEKDPLAGLLGSLAKTVSKAAETTKVITRANMRQSAAGHMARSDSKPLDVLATLQPSSASVGGAASPGASSLGSGLLAAVKRRSAQLSSNQQPSATGSASALPSSSSYDYSPSTGQPLQHINIHSGPLSSGSIAGAAPGPGSIGSSGSILNVMPRPSVNGGPKSGIVRSNTAVRFDVELLSGDEEVSPPGGPTPINSSGSLLREETQPRSSPTVPIRFGRRTTPLEGIPLPNDGRAGQAAHSGELPMVSGGSSASSPHSPVTRRALLLGPGPAAAPRASNPGSGPLDMTKRGVDWSGDSSRSSGPGRSIVSMSAAPGSGPLSTGDRASPNGPLPGLSRAPGPSSGVLGAARAGLGHSGSGNARGAVSQMYFSRNR